ncbi:MAG: CpsD/CapB family tyrosine-protein kinase [Desulfomonilaceae bacterium]
MIKTFASSYSDQLHKLQWALFQEKQPSRTRVIQITSARFSEGVSTVTLALAGAMGRIFGEDSTVVLEANLRQPSFHQMLGAGSPASIQDVLKNEGAALNAAARLDEFGFSVISAVPSPVVGETEGPEFYLEKIGVLIDILKAKFRYILIDSPPVVPFVDSDIISGFVDGVAIVVEANSTRAEILDVAINRLKSVDAKILGLILNKRVLYIPKWLYRFL